MPSVHEEFVQAEKLAFARGKRAGEASSGQQIAKMEADLAQLRKRVAELEQALKTR